MRMNSVAAPLLAGALLLSAAAGLASAEASTSSSGGPLPLLSVPASAPGAAVPASSVAASAASTAGSPSAGLPPLRAGALDVPGEAELALRAAAGSEIPALANNQVLAFYGHPFSKRMGILGEYSKEELAKLLKGYAKLYDEANGPGLGVVPAFYLIYGTCWPEGEIGYLRESAVKEYIEYAASQGMMVFVDHQIGKYKVEEAVRRLLPFAKYPNVHLALDPEWRTTAPMKEIGSISAEELNKAQAMIDDYLREEGIPGRKMLVVHQFKGRMIEGRERVRADFEKVILIHTADGFGAPALKRNAYAFNAQAPNMPIKGFKLFFKTSVPGAGYDEPLLTPPEVVALDPMPMLIIYQ